MADEQNIPYPKIAKWMQEAMMTYRLREGDYMANQKDIALKCGLHPVTFGRYLNGDQRPSDSACDAIAKVLGAGIYEAAGKPARLPTDKKMQKLVTQDLPYLNDDERRTIYEQAHEMAERHRQRGEQMAGKTSRASL